MVKLGAYLYYWREAGEQVAAHTQLRDAWADISDRLVSLGGRIVGIRKPHAVEDDDLELVELGLLAADLVEAHLLGHLGGEDDWLLRLVVGGVLLVQSCEKVRLAVVWPGRADEGC